MLEIFDQNPSSRVFHVDRECYVVYLGSHWDDYKPFLRIGTSRELQSGLPRIISTIVVPDVLTGNPLDEPASLAGDATPETHYIGDLKTVRKLKKFLKQETIPVEAMKRASREVDDDDHVYVYSYTDGNLKVKYHKNEVFDLHRREKLDAHFPARAQSIKNEYGRSPFKLPVEVYQRPGFAVVDDVVYLVSRGELAALSLVDDYFEKLALAGIDPDRITTVHAGEAGEALVRFFKRSRAKGKAVRVSTPLGVQAAALGGLFIANSIPALKAQVIKGSGGSFTFHRFTVGEAPGRLEAQLDGMDGALVFGSSPAKSKAAITVDAAAGVLTLSDRRKRALLSGCVYQIANETLSRTLIAQRYLPEKNYPYRDMLSKEENALVDQLGYFFSELYAGRDTGKVLRTIKSSPLGRDLGRSAALNPVTEIVVANTAELIRFLADAEPGLAKRAEGLLSLLERRTLKPEAIPALYPFVGEISHREGKPYLFYRIAQRITSDRVGHAQTIAEKIAAVPIVDHEAERNRLAELVAGLANPEQMEEARLRKIAERKKEQAKAKTAPEDTAEDKRSEEEKAAVAAAAGATGRGGSAGRGARGGSKSRRSPWRWIIPVGVIILVLAALLALLLTGSIPNPWFGKDDQGVADTAGTTDATGTGTDGDGVAVGDGEDAGTEGTGTEGAGTEGAIDTEPGETPLPEGWPPETLPAIQALAENPEVTILSDRVIGPGGIEITLLDIIALVNRIATDNGYARMDVIDPERPDPDWIYPGNLFVLPNTTRYTVVSGDTLWAITVRYMVARLQQDYRAYVLLTEEYDAADTTEARRRAIRDELLSIAEESHSENFTVLVEETLADWQE
jgi:nucleoid-associated protein YgaU